MIKAVIIDDDRVSLIMLRKMILDNFGGIDIIGEAYSADQGIQLIKRIKPELVFLDIEMPHKSGFDMLDAFDTIDFEIIFITSHDEYAIKAIKISALDYILKPIKADELKAAINKFLKNHNSKNQALRHNVLKNELKNETSNPLSIVLPTSREFHITSPNDIIRCQSDSYYTNVFTLKGEKIMVSRTLKEFEGILSESGFIRVHNSHLVNTLHVKSFHKSEGGYLIMSDNEKIPVSRRKKENILSYLKTKAETN